MTRFITILFVTLSLNSYSQVICGTANEGGTVTLTAPPNNTFTSIEFASYGTPNGACGSFTIGTCHASNSMSIVEAIFLGQNSASLGATNGVFGDPCNGTVKRLYIQARYTSTLPLSLVSFTVQNNDRGEVKLDWRSEEEVFTSHFVIERSLEGGSFESIGSVQAVGSGANLYSYNDNLSNISENYLYRLRMVDIDGNFRFSSIARVNNNASRSKMTVYPNPAMETITIVSNKNQNVSILNAFGQAVKQIRLIKGSQLVNIGFCSPGIYFIKGFDGVEKFVKN